MIILCITLCIYICIYIYCCLQNGVLDLTIMQCLVCLCFFLFSVSLFVFVHVLNGMVYVDLNHSIFGLGVDVG